MDKAAKLNTFSVKDFKSFGEATLHFAPLTLLVGTNASGKSNLLEALRLLSGLAGGERLENALRGQGLGAARGVRGRLADLCRWPGNSFGMGCLFESAGAGCAQYEVEIACDHQEGHILAERLGLCDGDYLFELAQPATGPSHETRIRYNAFRAGRHPLVAANDERLGLCQMRQPEMIGGEDRLTAGLTSRTAAALWRGLSNIRILDAVPAAMHGYSHVSFDLGIDGSGVSAALWHLDSVGLRDAVLSFVQDLPDENIVGMSFVTTAIDDVMVTLRESFGGRHADVPAPLLSDGTLRVLAIAAATLISPEGSVVVIEEIDNGVHPSRASMLLDRLREVADARGLTILITTHNPALLDAVPRDLVPAVTCCYRDPATGHSQLTRIGDLETCPELLAEGPLGTLLSRSRLEAHATDKTTAEERRRAALDWLRRLTEDAA